MIHVSGTATAPPRGFLLFHYFFMKTNAFVPERDAADLHLPVIITGLSGGGKSTVAAEVEKRGEIAAITYTGRLTTRSLRPDEREGKDGRFGVPRTQFDVERDDLFFRYEKYGELYGFSRTALRDCLHVGNTFIIGGEPNTALPIKEVLNAPAERARLNDVALRAVTLFVRRPILEIVQSIVQRAAPDAEKLKRIAHVVHQDTHEGGHDGFQFDYEVLNGKQRLEETVREVTALIQHERRKQLRDVFGSSFSHFADHSAVAS